MQIVFNKNVTTSHNGVRTEFLKGEQCPEELVERLESEGHLEILGEAKPIVDAPVVEAPVVEAPVVEAPVVEAPVVEAPVEMPVEEAPVVEAPVVEAPVEMPVEEAPVVEAPVEMPVEEAPIEEPSKKNKKGNKQSMSYCTVADVSSEFKNTTFTASDNVTDTDVSSFIDQATALIDGYVGKSYVLPVDSSVAGYQVLKMLCINLVAERVRAIMEVKQATNADGNQNPRRPYDMKQAMQTLKDIASQEIQLTGAVQLGGSSGSMFSQNVYDGIEPTFKKGSTQW